MRQGAILAAKLHPGGETMATGKRYFWIRLSTDFMNSDSVDFLMQQDHGADCIVLYLMMCLAARNSGGKLQSQIGDMIIPFDSQRIARESKFFTADFVDSTLPLFKRLGLIYEDADGALLISGFDEMIGSRTDYADQKARQRQRAKSVDNVRKNVHTDQEQEQYQEQEQEREKEQQSPSPGDCEFGGPLFTFLQSCPWFNDAAWNAVQQFKSYGCDDSLIRFAAKKAMENNAYSFGYMRTLLDGYVEQGIFTEKDAINHARTKLPLPF